MPSKREEKLRRTSAESHHLSVATQASCEDTQNHIKASHGAIARSLALLGRPFTRIFGD